jgi:hypothetical protein
MRRNRLALRVIATKVGGPMRYALRHAHAFPHLLYQLWHDADVRWSLGQGPAEMFSGWWEHHASHAARQQHAAWWHHRHSR